MKFNKLSMQIRGVLAILIALVLFYTAIDKLGHFQLFRGTLKESTWLWIRADAVFMSWLIPIVELSIVFLLVFPNSRTIGFISAMILFLVFAFYIGSIWFTGKRVPCGCSLLIERLSFKNHLWLNLGLALISLIGWLSGRFLKIKR